jgi:hypothetical protein
MDRIREAVTRARDVRRETAGEAPRRFAPAPAPGVEGLRQVACDFEKFARNRIISNEQDPVLASYRILRTRILQKMEAKGWRTLAVVSPNSGAGKTVTAINLAIAVGSKAGTRALLVDLDFYRPSLAAYLGVREAPSALDFFEGKAALKDVVVRPDLPDVLLAANERVSRRGAEHLTSAKADELISRGLGEFGAKIMIFDISPILGCDDAIAFLPKVDCALMIAASGSTRAGDLKDAIRLVGEKKMLGTVLNKAPAASVAKNYYY